MSLIDHAQPGVLSDPTEFAEYLTFVLHDGDLPTHAVAAALAMLANATTSIRQKDPYSELSSTIGIGAHAWPRLFPDAPVPEELTPFVEMSDGPRYFPATRGDVFVMVKSRRIDLTYQTAKYVIGGFRAIAECIDDTRGFGYLDDRALIDFVDGTENPAAQERADSVLVPDGPYAGGSHLLIQCYLDRPEPWEALTTEEQEAVIGRTKMDDIELPDAHKQPYAHNVRSKVTVDGEEVHMYRQNRAIGTGLEHGTMFVGFASTASTLTTALTQMITADAAGHYDHLLDFVTATTGATYFVPPQTFLDARSG